MARKGVYNYYLLRGRLTRGKPKGCGTPSKGTKIKVKAAPDVRIKICHPIKKTKRKVSRKKGRTRKQPKYKGHRTSRGLKQDMRLKSQEKHEKAYRKQKRKSKR